jgi:hypothetical protein
METALITIFSFGLAFAVGTWLRNHLALACLAGLALASAAWAALKTGNLLAPVLVVSVGALCGAFRAELAPFWDRARRSASAKFSRGRDGSYGGGAGEAAEAAGGARPDPPAGSGFGRGPTPEERKRREAEAEQTRRGPEPAAAGRGAAGDGWKRENEERGKKERAAADAAARAAEQAAAAARDQARQQENARRDRARRDKEREEAAKAAERARAGAGAGDEEARRVPKGNMGVDEALDVLGLPKTAAPQSVKKAYRKMAMRWHPDRNQGDKRAEDAFKKVQAAYEALKAAGKAA